MDFALTGVVMSTIHRRDFTNALSHQGGYIDVSRPSPALQALHDEGITQAELDEIAGPDRVIRGAADFRRLFQRLDDLDSNGRASSFDATRPDGSLTAAGRVYAALETQAEANRARAGREGGRRFADDANLARVMSGRAALERGDRGDHVRKIQQALVDMGYGLPTHGVNGTYNAETAQAVRRFQREVGLGIDGQVGKETLGALAATAPPPGQRLERSAEYDRLYADGRLDMTIALGYDEHGTTPRAERITLAGLRAQGFRAIDTQNMTADQRALLERNGRAFDPNARYFHRRFQDPNSGRDVDAIVRFITPGSDGAAARASFQRALEEDEVVIYSGHARYGTGPDFDHINQGDGNFVFDGHGNRRAHAPPAGLRASIGNRPQRSDLRSLTERPDYQVLVCNACSTEEYLPNLRNADISGRDMGNLDIIATTIPTRLASNGAHAVRFVEGFTAREGNQSMLDAQSRIEQRQLEHFNMDTLVPAAGYTYTESGFLGNHENRVVNGER